MAENLTGLQWAEQAFRDQSLNTRYDTYRDYVEGKHNLAFATAKYAQVFGAMFADFNYNRCGVVIDSHADRLQVERFIVEAGGASETAGDLWRRNRMDGRAGEIHKAALRDGDAYVVVWPEAGTALSDTAAFPQFWPAKSEYMRVDYDDETPGKVVLAAKSWLTGTTTATQRRRLNLYYPDRIEKYVTTSAGTTISAATFVEHRPQGEPWPVLNPWGTVPVFHFANNADTGAYGASELRDVIPLQDGLNKSLKDLLAACELAGFPQKVIEGLDAGDENVLEGLRRLEAGLNKIFMLPSDGSGNKPSIAEFTAANLPQLIAVVEMFDKLISRVSRVPVHYLQMSGDFPSGRALRTAEAPFVAKIEDRQTSFGNVWEDAMHLALRQAGVANPGLLTTVWKAAAPLSREDAWDLAILQNSVGVPLEQILREIGYDEEEITAITAIADQTRAETAAMFAVAGAGAPGQSTREGRQVAAEDEDEGETGAVA